MPWPSARGSTPGVVPVLRGVCPMVARLSGPGPAAEPRSARPGPELSHPPSLAAVLAYVAFTYCLRQEAHAAQEQAEAAMALASAQGFPQWLAVGMHARGWALAMQGQERRGWRRCAGPWQRGGPWGQGRSYRIFLPYWPRRCGQAGQAEEGLRLLAEALAHMDTTGERYFAAEVYRLKGELLLRQAIPDETRG